MGEVRPTQMGVELNPILDHFMTWKSHKNCKNIQQLGFAGGHPPNY